MEPRLLDTVLRVLLLNQNPDADKLITSRILTRVFYRSISVNTIRYLLENVKHKGGKGGLVLESNDREFRLERNCVLRRWESTTLK